MTKIPPFGIALSDSSVKFVYFLFFTGYPIAKKQKILYNKTVVLLPF